jgi:hypothetical protein
MNLIKRITAWVFRGRLVWLRNIDNTAYLSVAYPIKSTPDDPVMKSHRFWPNLREVVLLDNGSVQIMGESSYVRHWIDAAPGQQTYMLFKNYENYVDFWKDI